MKRHWDKTILPLFKKIKPKHIVEIGSDTGLNTKNILSYCEEVDSTLTSIDPKPNFDVDKLKEQYPCKFELIEDLSLNVLPSLDDVDVILIDGDHNWYTVYNELKLIEKNYTKSNKYPLVLFHDICWPYGRRDLYYNPETIPEEYMHPYAEKGILPNQKELVSEIGLNDHGFNNALYEGGKRNGVLTAIEDYMDESQLDLLFYSIPAYYGLGILFLNDEKLKYDVESIINYPQIMKELEGYYLTIIHSNLRRQISQLNQKNKKLKIDFNDLIEKNSFLQNENYEKDKLIKELEDKICFYEKNLKEKERIINTMQKDIVNLKDDVNKIEKKVNKLSTGDNSS